MSGKQEKGAWGLFKKAPSLLFGRQPERMAARLSQPNTIPAQEQSGSKEQKKDGLTAAQASAILKAADQRAHLMNLDDLILGHLGGITDETRATQLGYGPDHPERSSALMTLGRHPDIATRDELDKFLKPRA